MHKWKDISNSNSKRKFFGRKFSHGKSIVNMPGIHSNIKFNRRELRSGSQLVLV